MPDIHLLETKLRSADAEERREAVVDLGRSDSRAVPLLFLALGDADWRVRKTAVEALVSFADQRVVAGLVEVLSSHDNAGARNSAIEALIQIGERAVDSLHRSLQEPDPDVRKFAVDILGDIRDGRSVPLLIEMLTDPDQNVRVASAEALGKIRDRRAVDALLGCLARYDQNWLDYAAAEALGEIGDERALGPLIAALERAGLREPVLESIGKIGNVGTLTPLIDGLADPVRIVREVSVVALTTIYRKSSSSDRDRIITVVRKSAGDRIVDFLEEMVVASTGDLQKATLAVMGWAGRKRSIPKMLSVLKEEDMEEAMVQALGRMDENSIDLLMEYLNDANPLVRRTTTRVLGSRGRIQAEDRLIELLRDENGHVRSTAAETLGHLKSRKSIPALLALLEDEYENVQESAIHALAAFADESVFEGLLTEFTTRNAGMRRNIALLVGKFSGDKAIDALAFALKDEESAVRKAVVHALGNLPGDRAYRSLKLAVTDDDAEVRMLAADALGRTERPEVVDALISLLQDPDLWVRASAARGLGRIGGERAGAVLIRHLSGASDIFLLAIIEVLGRLKPEAALEPLLKLTGHTDPEVRKTVLLSLAGYSWSVVRPAVLSQLSDLHWSVRKTAIDILRQKQDPAAVQLLERMVFDDPDSAVRRAAKEALEN